MTRATFGVSSSCFAANMALKQNAMDYVHRFPLAAEVAQNDFYVDDGLTGADSIRAAISLQRELQDLFTCANFLLRRWNSSEPSVLQAIFPEFRESYQYHPISDADSVSTKTLGLQWNAAADTFRITTAKFSQSDLVTKRILVSDIAKVFDALGWIAPAIVRMKILLQRVWEARIDWDDPVPAELKETWHQWRCELGALVNKDIPRCYFPQHATIVSLQLHGFSDASEEAYAGVVYLRMLDSVDNVHVSLVISKTKVSPIRRLTIPRFELCGAVVVTRLLQHVKDVLEVPLSDVYAWTDSSIVLNWLSGNPRRFKTYVGNRISEIVDQLPSDHWNHVRSAENPADCASRGLSPSELLKHTLWWEGPQWLSLAPTHWPPKLVVKGKGVPEELRDVNLAAVVNVSEPVMFFDRYSSYTRLQRVTAWILRFIRNCQPSHVMDQEQAKSNAPCLSVDELATAADTYLLKVTQEEHFSKEITSLQSEHSISKKSRLLHLRPSVDPKGVLRVGGREQHSKLSYSRKHPIILHGSHALVRLVIRSEHLRLCMLDPLWYSLLSPNVTTSSRRRRPFVSSFVSVSFVVVTALSLLRNCWGSYHWSE